MVLGNAGVVCAAHQFILISHFQLLALQAINHRGRQLALHFAALASLEELLLQLFRLALLGHGHKHVLVRAHR